MGNAVVSTREAAALAEKYPRFADVAHEATVDVVFGGQRLYRMPDGTTVPLDLPAPPSEADLLRSQIAALQAEVATKPVEVVNTPVPVITTADTGDEGKKPPVPQADEVPKV